MTKNQPKFIEVVATHNIRVRKEHFLNGDTPQGFEPIEDTLVILFPKGETAKIQFSAAADLIIGGSALDARKPENAAEIRRIVDEVKSVQTKLKKAA
jgi:hypothetical protein